MRHFAWACLVPLPHRHAPQVLIWGLRNVHRPQMIPIWILHWASGLLASISETETGPWGRGRHSAVSGAGPGPAVWPAGHCGVSGGAPCCCVHEASPGGECDPRESVGKSHVGLSAGVDRPESLLRQWPQSNVCSSWWGLPCVYGLGSEGMCWP